MNLNLAIPLALHTLASTLWIGGMFFALVALRPGLRDTADPALRIKLSLAVFRHFFPWVWTAIATLWISGYWIGIAAHDNHFPLHVHLMMGIALVMTLIFAWLFAFPYRQMMRIATSYENWGWAAAKLGLIRRLMTVNLILGILNVITATAGPALLAFIPALNKV